MPSRNPKENRDRTSAERLASHQGLATWGEKLVPLALRGRDLTPEQRREEVSRFLRTEPDGVPVDGPHPRIAVFGGIYSNHLALAALLDDARRRGIASLYCLGDLGGFGPHPEKIWSLLEQGGVLSLQGNYEESLAAGREDCNCGYTDPRDNHFARVSYGYTAQNCSPAFRSWMGRLPMRRRVRVGNRELLLIHGSPRRINEFLFDSTTPDAYLEVLLDQEGCDGLLCTHTGLHWHRRLPSGRDVVNVGVIGRPANNGNRNIWYAIVGARDNGLAVDLVALDYDHRALAEEMRQESLPAEFIDTILSGWWTTCLEILPARERQASRF
jgi:hypothetical protein